MHKEIRDELLDKVKAGLDGPAIDMAKLVHNYKDFCAGCELDDQLGDSDFWDVVEPDGEGPLFCNCGVELIPTTNGFKCPVCTEREASGC